MTSVRPLSKPRSRNKLTDAYADVVLLVCECVCVLDRCDVGVHVLTILI